MARALAALSLAVAALTLAAPPAAQAAGTGSISGFVYNDDTGDGARSTTDVAHDACTVTLDQGANGSIDATVNPDAGTYTFANLAPGAYRVAATCSYSSGKPTAVHPATATTPPSRDITVALTGIGGTDFGFFDPPHVWGRIYADANRDGTLDPGEELLNGCTVTADRGLDGSADAQTTSRNGVPSWQPSSTAGSFELTLGPGRYRLAGTCPGLVATGGGVVLTTHSGVDVGTPTGVGPEDSEPHLGFAPAKATTTTAKGGTTTSTTGKGGTSTTLVAGSSTTSSSVEPATTSTEPESTTSTEPASTSGDDDGISAGEALGAALAAAAIAGVALALARQARRLR